MTSITRFTQILKPCTAFFQQSVHKHNANKYLKGFSCENLLQVMLFAQWSKSGSYRILESKINPHIKLLKRQNMPLISRSTVSYALQNRSTKPFEETVNALIELCRNNLSQQEYKQLKLLDSTPIQLKGKGFDKWVKSNSRVTGMKLHTVIDNQTYCLESYELTLANQTDVSIGKHLVDIQAGQTYVFDKGYCDYNWWWAIHQHQAFFVTRAKSNASVKVIKSNEIEDIDKQVILQDEVVQFVNHHQKKSRKNQYVEPLRRIMVARENHQDALVLFTNNLNAKAIDIATQYRSRWNIELWFKWIKQHLEVKHFLGKSENAVRIQLLCALIAYLLLRLYYAKCQVSCSLHHFFVWLGSALFERATKIDWKTRWHPSRRIYFGQ